MERASPLAQSRQSPASGRAQQFKGGAPVPVVLASESPRRADILRMLALEFQVVPAAIVERRSPGEPPQAYARRTAREKVERVSPRHERTLVIGGDTIVECRGQVLEKPRGEAEACRMLRQLAGVRHHVHTGLAVSFEGRMVTGVASAQVLFRPLSDAAIAAYVATGEPFGKAGAYGIQGRGASLVAHMEGDYHAIVGFSVTTWIDLLAELDLAYVPGSYPGGARIRPLASGDRQ